MAKLKPWYKVVSPREDLREGKPLDAAEFAVHLDLVRDNRATPDYQDPNRFFERTFITKSLLDLASQSVRRLSGETTATSAIFNMATQFGGGKTHALTLLYHLATHGAESHEWVGVNKILAKSGVRVVPKAATAVFVGTEFDSLDGRGGDDGTPRRKTPWGEIAFQLGGKEGFDVIAEHEKQQVAPGSDVIRKLLPSDQPVIILIDELMNYVNRNRASGLAGQLYSFVQNLCSVARGSDRIVLVASLPASTTLEMTPDDIADFKRFKKLLDREGKAILLAAEKETSEIIRRRLFEWDPRAVNAEGRVLLPKEAIEAAAEYSNWVTDNSTQLPMWFSADHSKEAFEATYPFHPSVLSVFERKWQELPGFQRTRGVLRLLALWVSHAYQHGYKGVRSDYLIDLGTAPLEDPIFRTAAFEQLGEQALEGAVTTDICGKAESHATRLDDEAVDTIRKARVHRRIATTIFFESNGGQIAKERKEATVPEIRLAVAGPELDLGNIETGLEGLIDACYYLAAEGSSYRFGTKENLNKRFSDRQGNVRTNDIQERIREEIHGVFAKVDGIENVFFPEEGAQIVDRPALRLIIADPDKSVDEAQDLSSWISDLTKSVGAKGRTFKSSLIWCAPQSTSQLESKARNLLAWETIRDEGLDLDDLQARQLDTSIKKAQRDLKESVWRSYKNLYLLNKDNEIAPIDLGLVTSSAAQSLTRFIVQRLRETDEIIKEVSPRFLVREWPPAKVEWSTKSVRDAFYSTPKFPRLQFPDTLKLTIARGVADGEFGYVGRASTGEYKPFYFEESLAESDVEITEDMYLIPDDVARGHKQPPQLARIEIEPAAAQVKPGTRQTFLAHGFDQRGDPYVAQQIEWGATGGRVSEKGVFEADQTEGNFLVSVRVGEIEGSAKVVVMRDDAPPTVPGSIGWEGNLPPQKWSNFYMKVLTKLVARGELDLSVSLRAQLESAPSEQFIEEVRAALRSLDLTDNIREG